MSYFMLSAQRMLQSMKGAGGGKEYILSQFAFMQPTQFS